MFLCFGARPPISRVAGKMRGQWIVVNGTNYADGFRVEASTIACAMTRISVTRSYLGFDAKPVRVVGSVHDYPLAAHFARNSGNRGTRTETQEHGLIEFEDGQLGVFHWTSVAYDSPLRWWRSSRFLAEKRHGHYNRRRAGHTRTTILLTPTVRLRLITIERRWERVDGGALEAIVAHTGDANQPLVRWDNPFVPAHQGHGPQWHDDEIGVASCIMSLVDAVRNNTEPSYALRRAGWTKN